MPNETEKKMLLDSLARYLNSSMLPQESRPIVENYIQAVTLDRVKFSVFETLLKIIAASDIRQVTDEVRIVLWKTAATSNTDELELLKALGADFNMQDAQGNIALMIAIQAFQLDASFNLIVELKVDVNTKNKRQQTPIMLAALSSGTDYINMLLRAGATTTLMAKDDEGNTALMYAVKSKNWDAVKILIKAGLNINEKNSSGLSPLMRIVEATPDASLAHLLFDLGINKQISMGLVSSPGTIYLLFVTEGIKNLTIVSASIKYLRKVLIKNFYKKCFQQQHPRLNRF